MSPNVIFPSTVLIPVIVCNKVLKLANIEGRKWYKLCSVYSVEEALKISNMLEVYS